MTPSKPLTFTPREQQADQEKYSERCVLTVYDSYLGFEEYDLDDALPAKVNDKLKDAHYVPFEE